MHSLIGTHFNYELATQRREVLTETARRRRVHRLFGGRRATAQVIPFSPANAAFSDLEHASARVA